MTHLNDSIFFFSKERCTLVLHSGGNYWLLNESAACFPVGSSQLSPVNISAIIRIIEQSTTSSSVSGLELPFMMMPHPLIPVSLPPASVTMAMSQMNHLSTIANMAAAAQGQSLPSRMVTSVIKVTFKKVRFLFKL